MPADIGKWFEDKVYAALQEIQSKHPAMRYRFPDTRSARNPLPAQPGDFMLLVNSMSILIEAKCSETRPSLRAGFSALWDKRQAAMHRKWLRSGNPTWVIFCDYTADKVEIWRGAEIALARSQGERILAETGFLTGSIATLEQDIMKALKIEFSRREIQ